MKLKKYRLVQIDEVTYVYEVEAKSEEEAIEKVHAGEGHLPEFDTFNNINLDVKEI